MRFGKYTAVLAFLVGAIGCHGQQLTRPTAQRILREYMASGKFGGEIKADVTVQVGWFEQMWQSNGGDVEQDKEHATQEISFRNHLVEAGVLQKAPDTPGAGGCAPQPNCIEHNKWLNFTVIPSPDVEDVYKGMYVQDVNEEFARVTLARPYNPVITGISLEGNEATVEFAYGYSLTPLFTRIVQLAKDDFAKCPNPVRVDQPLFCPGFNASWPSATDIASKRGTGTLEFRKYDDGWRIVQQTQ